MAHRRPSVGNWYQDAEAGVIFEVVAFDEEDGTVEVQHIDGEVEEYDLDSWREMRLTAVAPPEDWRSGFELSSEDAPDAPDARLQTTTPAAIRYQRDKRVASAPNTGARSMYVTRKAVDSPPISSLASSSPGVAAMFWHTSVKP